MLWALLSTNLVLIALAAAIVWVGWRGWVRPPGGVAGPVSGSGAASRGAAASDTLGMRSLVAIQETGLRKLHVIALTNSGRAEVVLDTVEVIAPKTALIAVRSAADGTWSTPARKAPLLLTVPPAEHGESDPLLQCSLHLPLGSRTETEAAAGASAVVRLSGAEMGGQGRRISVTRPFRLPAPGTETVAGFDPSRDEPQAAASDSSRYERAIAEACEREEAVRIVLDAVLASTWRRALDRRRFQKAVLAAARDTPDAGPEAARHAVFHAEAQKVLQWKR